MMNQRVSIFGDFTFQPCGKYPCHGRTGIIKSCHDDGSFGVLLDGYDHVLPFLEEELYFPDHPLGYNQRCFDA